MLIQGIICEKCGEMATIKTHDSGYHISVYACRCGHEMKRSDVELTAASNEEAIHEISQLLFAYCPSNKLPGYIVNHMQENCKRYGGCSEVLLESIHEAICKKILLGYEVKP